METTIVYRVYIGVIVGSYYRNLEPLYEVIETTTISVASWTSSKAQDFHGTSKRAALHLTLHIELHASSAGCVLIQCKHNQGCRCFLDFWNPHLRP